MARTVYRGFPVALCTLALAAPALPAQTADPATTAAALSQAFAAAAERVKPAVANISTTTIIPGRRDPFAGFFEHFFGRGGFTTPAQEVTSLGSGVVIRPDGFLVTNHHVVRGAQSIVVALGQDTELEAVVRGSDPASDLAVIKVDAAGLPTAQWGDSDSLQVGEWVIAIGSPHGLRYSVTAGIVSAKSRRDVGIATVEDFIQTDATINPGNSGGALVNLRGELIGIPTAILSKSGGYEGVGFAIPAKEAQQITDVLIREGRYPRGWIGIVTAPVGRQRAELAGIEANAGLLVDRLYRDSPAHRAGILPGDIITSCDGLAVTGTSTLVQALSRARLGGEIGLGIIRLARGQDGIRRTRHTFTVSIVEQPVDSEGRTPQGI